MKYSEIRCLVELNEVGADKVGALADSMLANGWQGCPILIYNDQLLTGSHRIAALREVERRYLADDDMEYPAVLDQDIAEDVTEIIEAALVRFVDENGYEPDIDYSNIGWLLEGSWVEQYKDEIVEW